MHRALNFLTVVVLCVLQGWDSFVARHNLHNLQKS